MAGKDDDLTELFDEGTATAMPVRTSSDVWPLIALGLGDNARPREKRAPDGRPTFATGAVLRLRTKDGGTRSDKSASVNVIEPLAEYVAGQVYRADGAIWVQPYESNTRVALSVTVERLVPIQ